MNSAGCTGHALIHSTDVQRQRRPRGACRAATPRERAHQCAEAPREAVDHMELSDERKQLRPERCTATVVNYAQQLCQELSGNRDLETAIQKASASDEMSTIHDKTQVRCAVLSPTLLGLRCWSPCCHAAAPGVHVRGSAASTVPRLNDVDHCSVQSIIRICRAKGHGAP